MSVLNVATGPATLPRLNDVIGQLPYRMAFAGGWIDQPFLSMLNPGSTGSMVTVGLQPVCRFMDRCGMGTSTRRAAAALWQGKLPRRDPAQLARELYRAENQGNSEPSGSQDMIGLIYPGVNRLDYDYAYEGGLFPVHVETNCDPVVAHWLEAVIYLLPINQRPPGYNPLGVKNLDTEWIRRLGQSGADCYDAILARDAQALGASFNECVQCWAAILPHTVRHPTITIDLVGLLEYYQARYPGAMYSGCGGGYLYVVSERPVPGALRVHVRLGEESD
jgi:hypothetical protein